MDDVTTLSRPTATSPRRARRAAFVQRYWAFLSYSHRDATTADWLHNAIECFKVPKRLVGRGTPYGLVPARLAPVFRDQHDLAAGDDLHEDIKQALAASRFLVVICSPAAVASKWVDREVRLFRQLRPDGEAFAAVVDGEPWASTMPGRETEECFPLCLRQACDEQGQPTGERAEPIAADLRPFRDGRQLGLQKIVAGMLDIGLDELVQREAHRRHRHMLTVTGASVVGMIGATALAVTAIQARDEARDQRREAESLVGFMLSDLRETLEPIGRLDALGAVGARALAYYEKQDKEELSDEGLSQRSRALTLLGDVAEKRGDLNVALRHYSEALASTSELARRYPDDPQRLFDHAQNMFYFGSIAWQRGRADEAIRSFRQYKALAERMIALEPERKEWRLEGIYADTNLGMTLLRQKQYEEAGTLFRGTLVPTERLLAAEPTHRDYQKQLMETLAYMADASQGAGQLRQAIGERERQLALGERFLAADPGNMDFFRKEMVARRALAQLYLQIGDVAGATKQAEQGVRLAGKLMSVEPSNAEWADRATSAYFAAADVALAGNRLDSAAAATRTGCDIVARLIARDPTVVDWTGRLRRACLLSEARLALSRNEPATAAEAAEQAVANARASREPTGERVIDLAEARLISGEAYRLIGQPGQAAQAWRAGLAEWPATPSLAPKDMAIRALLLARSGNQQAAAPLRSKLRAIGYRHPLFTRAMQQGG